MNSKTEKGMALMLIALRECPHCGHEAEMYLHISDNPLTPKAKEYVVRCEKCRCGTPVCWSMVDAANIWNARTGEDYSDEDGETVKVYISLPDKGLTEEERYEIQKKVCEKICRFLNKNVELCETYPQDESSWLEVLSKRLQAIDDAEYVVFPDGCEMNDMSRIEYAAALKNEKKIKIV